MRWIVAIVTGFAIMIAVNFYFAYVAVTGADPVVGSYESEAR